MQYDKLYDFKVALESDKGEKEYRKFFIRKPNRRLNEDSDLFHGRMINEAITKHKLIPKALLAKTYTEHDGVYTEKEKNEYKDLLTKMRDLETEYQSILLKDSELRSEKEEERLDDITDELFNIRTKIRDFELQEDSLYEYTAESYARKKFIFWWVVNTAYEEINENEHKLILSGDTYDDKLDSYDKLVEQNEKFWSEVFGKFTYYIAIWLSPNVSGNTNTFHEVMKILDAQKDESKQGAQIEDNISEDVENQNSDAVKT